jgi:hypothetical protein
VRVRAERGTGELLASTKKTGERQRSGGDRISSSVAATIISQPNLESLGISKDQSSKGQKLAAIPQKKFDQVEGRDTSIAPKCPA